MDFSLCFIKEKYFIDNSNFVKMLDPGDSIKQSKRIYLCLQIKLNSNNFYIPLRNNLKEDIKPYGRIGHMIPSKSRPDAGFDYRYSLIINNSSYIEPQTTPRIPNSQLSKIKEDIFKIENEFKTYLRGFIKAARKSRIKREPLYRESSLINFTEILLQEHSNI